MEVVYMTRSDGRTANPGRHIVNEEQVLQGIRTLLAERNRGEELVVFNPDNFRTTDELFLWFSQNVAAVVGPHGGAMINHRWSVFFPLFTLHLCRLERISFQVRRAAKGTLVLEMQPTTRISMMIFEEASVLSQNYASIIVPPTARGGTDMEIDVGDVVSLLTQHLGVAGEHPLRTEYHWRAKELELDEHGIKGKRLLEDTLYQ